MHTQPHPGQIQLRVADDNGSINMISVVRWTIVLEIALDKVIDVNKYDVYPCDSRCPETSVKNLSLSEPLSLVTI
jgi:hypothetical protein